MSPLNFSISTAFSRWKFSAKIRTEILSWIFLRKTKCGLLLLLLQQNQVKFNSPQTSKIKIELCTLPGSDRIGWVVHVSVPNRLESVHVCASFGIKVIINWLQSDLSCIIHNSLSNSDWDIAANERNRWTLHIICSKDSARMHTPDQYHQKRLWTYANSIANIVQAICPKWVYNIMCIVRHWKIVNNLNRQNWR